MLGYKQMTSQSHDFNISTTEHSGQVFIGQSGSDLTCWSSVMSLSFVACRLRWMNDLSLNWCPNEMQMPWDSLKCGLFLLRTSLADLSIIILPMCGIISQFLWHLILLTSAEHLKYNHNLLPTDLLLTSTSHRLSRMCWLCVYELQWVCLLCGHLSLMETTL